MPRRKTLFARRDVAPRTFIGTDDARGTVVRRSVTGINTRQHPSVIDETETKNLVNADLTVAGEVKRRPGITLIEDVGNNPITGSFGYDPQGFTANLLITEGTNLKRWEGSGSFANIKTDFTSGLPTKIIKAYKSGVGDVALVSNGTDNVFEVTPGTYAVADLGSTAGTGSDSPPKSPVMTTYRNRVWVVKNGLAYFSDASPSNYATAFDTATNNYRVPIGDEKAIIATRDVGLIFLGTEQVWGLNPSTVPAATDKPEKLSEYGSPAGETLCQVGDDYMYFAYDGVRELYRTNLDKLQYGSSLPSSYKLKTQFDSINWSYIQKACAVSWNNKYLIALPTAGAAYNNQVWVYFPSTKGWLVINGWNVSSWAKFKVGGEERLYFGDAVDGDIYRAWFGASDGGTAIDFVIEGRDEDLGYPLIKKYAGELKVGAKPVGDYNISVYGSFDDGAYNLLGYLNVANGLTVFPTTFPITFSGESKSFVKFPLDSYGEWYTFRHKIEHNAVTTNADDITIYETSLTAIPQEYDPEETT